MSSEKKGACVEFRTVDEANQAMSLDGVKLFDQSLHFTRPLSHYVDQLPTAVDFPVVLENLNKLKTVPPQDFARALSASMDIEEFQVFSRVLRVLSSK
mmetsp:Transcript_57036/g.134244  ORF Transcript_57036/g.134244 Transcript_57036/m.134244 type:complete len:98 (+) Transcript_57036:72-365(+)